MSLPRKSAPEDTRRGAPRADESARGSVFPTWPRRTARLVFAAALLGLGLWLARDFLLALGWAVLIAIAVWPLYRRFIALLPKHRRSSVLAPLVFTLLAGLVLLVPLAFAAVEAGREGQKVVEWVAEVQQNGIPEPGWLGRMPVLGERVSGWWRAHLSDPQRANQLLGGIDKSGLANWTRLFGAELLHRLFLFFVTLMALFFLFRDGGWLGPRLLAHADNLLGDPGERLAERMVAATRGTVNGTVLVALGEGVLIGLGYVVAGVPRPVLFGAITAAFAMVPFGAWVAFTAAALVLLSAGGSALMAGGLFVYGAVVMLAGDNLVQPALIGGAVRLPFLWALIGIFGGAETFGLLGLFLGPVIMAALMMLWRDWINADRPSAENQAER